MNITAPTPIRHPSSFRFHISRPWLVKSDDPTILQVSRTSRHLQKKNTIARGHDTEGDGGKIPKFYFSPQPTVE